MVYNECTLFKIENKGLAIVQQRFDSVKKATYWASIDPWLSGDLYLHENFERFFNDRAGELVDGLYLNERDGRLASIGDLYDSRNKHSVLWKE